MVLTIHPDDPDIQKLTSHGLGSRASRHGAHSWEMYRDCTSHALAANSPALRRVCGNALRMVQRPLGMLSGGFRQPVILCRRPDFEDLLPTGKGLFEFTIMDEAVEAIRAVRADYPLHSAAARQMAPRAFRFGQNPAPVACRGGSRVMTASGFGGQDWASPRPPIPAKRPD